MQKKSVNPWTWQDHFSFSQAIEVSGDFQTLLCAGQASISEDGKPLYENDMEAQLKCTLDNIGTVLRKADYEWATLYA